MDVVSVSVHRKVDTGRRLWEVNADFYMNQTLEEIMDIARGAYPDALNVVVTFDWD